MMEPKDNDLEVQLCRYLDGELSRRERLALEKRLEEDEALRRELRRYALLEGYLGAISAEELDGVDYDVQRAEILAAVEKKALLAPPRRRPFLLRPTFRITAAAAAVLLAVSAGVFLFRPGETTEKTRILVIVHPSAPRPSGPAEVSVEISAPRQEDWPVPVPQPAGGMPAGTIVVSVSPETPPPPAEDVGAMMIY